MGAATVQGCDCGKKDSKCDLKEGVIDCSEVVTRRVKASPVPENFR